MKKNSLFGFLFGLGIAANVQSILSENAKISLLTTEPFDYVVYTLYGHTSIRWRICANFPNA